MHEGSRPPAGQQPAMSNTTPLRLRGRLLAQGALGGGILLLVLATTAEFCGWEQSSLAPALGVYFAVIGLSAWFFQRSVRRRLEDLESARRAAEAAAQSQGKFLASMSHEIRTPMNGILGMAELLVRTRLDSEQEQMATTIHSSAESLLAVLNDILDYSKIEAGKLDLETADFDLWQLVDECAGLLHGAADHKGVELMTFIDPRIWRCHSGDQARVRQVLLNFLSNAVKFTIEGEVILAADVVDDDPTSQLVRLSVRDTGIGITSDTMSRLFTPFSQADASTTRRFGGTGLGLTICKRLVEMMGGRVDVQSVPAQGSTFAIELRLQKGTVPSTRPRTEDVDMSRGAVLVVDDHETSRQLIVTQLVLTHLGIDVATDRTGAMEVLRHAASVGHPFTMVVINLSMPAAGMHLADAIRNDPSIPPLPVALVSSLGTRPGLPDMAAAHLFRWLTKPLAAGRLLQLVRDMSAVGGPQEAVRRPRPIEQASQAAGQGARLAGMRVLVAEDNEINRRVIAGMLRRLGCEATFAVDGRESVQFVEQRDFDLVLMDCQMPEMDGFEATRRIRELDGARADVPIVALTANVLNSDREACLEAGMNAFLAKPVTLDVLRTAAQRWGRTVSEGAASSSSRTPAP